MTCIRVLRIKSQSLHAELFMSPCKQHTYEYHRNLKEFDIKLKVREKKADKLQKLRFEPVVIPKNSKALAKSELCLKIFEKTGELRRQVTQ